MLPPHFYTTGRADISPAVMNLLAIYRLRHIAYDMSRQCERCLRVTRISEIGDRASEGLASGVCGTGFILGSLPRLGARDRKKWPSIEIGSDEEFMKTRRMAEFY